MKNSRLIPPNPEVKYGGRCSPGGEAIVVKHCDVKYLLLSGWRFESADEEDKYIGKETASQKAEGETRTKRSRKKSKGE